METLFAVLHVVAAVFIIGPMAILPMAGLRSLRGGNSAQVNGFARATNVFGWLSLVVAVLGFGLVAFVDPEDKLTYTTPWLLTSIILYAVAVTIVLSGVAPLMKRAGERLADGKLAMEYRPIAALSGLSALLLVAVVVLMVWRP
ncbi:MAG: DUF2269 domain-containing protein [Actinobacteria bacterium]|nr:DUF2269 domain-containing protein [Actinomycetota bacterium]